MAAFNHAFSGDAAALQAFLAAQPAKVNKRCPSRGTSLLYTASRFGHTQCARALIAAGADVNLCNKSDDGSSPLHGAAYGGHPAIVELLIKEGAQFKANRYGETPLDNATAHADTAQATEAATCVTLLQQRDQIAAAAAPPSPQTSVAPAVPDPAPAPVQAAPAPAPVADATPAATSKYHSMGLPQLRTLCQSAGLSTAGTKTCLAAALAAHDAAAAAPAAAPPVAAPVAPAPAAPTPVPAAPVAEAVAASSADPAAAQAALTALTLAALRALCGQHGLPQSGVKKTLVARLVENNVSATGTNGSSKTAAAESADEPAPKKAKGEPEAGGDGPDRAASWISALQGASFTKELVEKDTEAFWSLEERVMAWNQGRNDDYVKLRLKAKKPPITFILKNAWKVTNPTLEAAFKERREAIAKERGDAVSRVRVAFHGTRPKHIDSILKTCVLPFKHPLNPCKTQADDGWFGTNRKGVYVSRYFDYTLKYCNGLNPLDEGETAKVIMFKCVPGKTFHVTEMSTGMQPTAGHDSHSSPSHLEWYVFDERQLCPEFVIEIQAKLDTRTAADDQ